MHGPGEDVDLVDRNELLGLGLRLGGIRFGVAQDPLDLAASEPVLVIAGGELHPVGDASAEARVGAGEGQEQADLQLRLGRRARRAAREEGRRGRGRRPGDERAARQSVGSRGHLYLPPLELSKARFPHRSLARTVRSAGRSRLRRLLTAVQASQFAANATGRSAALPSSTVTSAVFVPSFSCQASTVYLPGGTSLISKRPSAPEVAK